MATSFWKLSLFGPTPKMFCLFVLKLDIANGMITKWARNSFFSAKVKGAVVTILPIQNK